METKETERSEDQILRGEGTVIFGGETYTIQELKGKDTLEFRKSLGKMLAPYLSILAANKQADWPSKLLPTLLGEGLDEMKDLIFVYDPTLPKEEILEKATEVEMVEAASVLLDLIFPLLDALIRMTKKILDRVS